MSSTHFIVSTSNRTSSNKRYNTLLQKILKLNIDYSPFTRDDTALIAPAEFAAVLRQPNCTGGAISKHIKHSIIPYLDQLDEHAEALQSVNTIVCHDGILHGYNTDFFGFNSAVSALVSSLQIKTAVIYGYGGVTSVAVQALNSLNVRCLLTGRNLSKATERAVHLNIEVFNPISDIADMFVNCAPVTDQVDLIYF